MIREIKFKNFRNLNNTFVFNDNLNIIIGMNNSGKTNLLDGIRLAFSTISGDYFKIKKSDFYNSDDNTQIEIKVLLEDNDIPSLFEYDENKRTICGFTVEIYKLSNGKYKKELFTYNHNVIDKDILQQDDKVPEIFTIPFIRVDDIYIDGLTTGISRFIENNLNYEKIKEKSKEAIKNEIKNKEQVFIDLCKKFDQSFELTLTDAKIENEKLFIVENGGKEHNYSIGSGYKSIANIILNTMQDNNSIILIDEIENHLHPALIRTLIRELKYKKNLCIVATTHSPVVINEFNIKNIIDVKEGNFYSLSENCVKKLNTFMHPGRGELLLANNVILVEGYTEELLLLHYLHKTNDNITIVNVAGIMFEPYIELAKLLNKHVVVISDNDISTNPTGERSSRFNNLLNLCNKNGIKLLEMYNTLETDLYKAGFLLDCKDKMEKKQNYMVAKPHKKVEIIEFLIDKDIDLSDWHIIKEIKDEFKSD